MSDVQPKAVPASYRDLVDQPIVAAVGTTLPDGTAQVTPVWFSTDEAGYFYFNTAVGRLKDKAIKEHPYVALMILDPANPYRYLAVRGPVVLITEEGAREHINQLSARYTGQPVYTFGPPDEPRVMYKIAPEHVSFMG